MEVALTDMKNALTDTAAAAAQWVKVDDEHVVVPVKATEAMKDAGLDPFVAHATSPMFSGNEPCGPVYKAMIAAAPKAGEPEGYRERYKRELLAAFPAKPEPEDGG